VTLFSPVPDEGSRRGLRGGFDADAGAYDRTRPVCPDVLFDDLVRLARLGRGDRVLEIGCGTGQATVPMAERGLAVTAVELGAALADLARHRTARFPGVAVATTSFEELMAPPNAYRNMSRNTALWIVVNTMSWGVRANFRTVRPATAIELGHNPAPVLSAARGTPGDGAIIDALVMMMPPVCRPDQAPTVCSDVSVVCAGFPVRARKTSSSVGRRNETSSTAMPRASKARSASIRRLLPSSTAT
jgi:SAM-dependent methyltransferase